jgi:hypothetical protein
MLKANAIAGTDSKLFEAELLDERSPAVSYKYYFK